MAKGAKPKLEDQAGVKVVVRNRRALHDYFVEKRFEAGLALVGSEVKSLRDGGASLSDAYAAPADGDLLLHNCNIATWKSAGAWLNHAPLRPRRLLLHRREIDELSRAVNERGYTLVPLALYFKNGRAKAEIGLCKGKAHADKRQAIAEREHLREIDRAVRGRRGPGRGA